MLALVLTAYKDGLCTCGRPIGIAHHPDNDGWYEAAESICNACAAIERHREDEETPEPGAKVYSKYTRPADLPIGAKPNRKRRKPAEDQ